MTPERFEQELNARMGRDFDMKYRVRESPNQQFWLIEQKVGRGAVEVPMRESDESYARARDGYGLVLRTLKYPRFQCPSCCLTVSPVPEMAIGEVRCAYCDDLGERNIFFLGYFPLCDKLLTHLEQTHPKRGDKWQQEHAAHNKRNMAETDRKAHTLLEGIFTDDWRRIQQIPRTYLADHRTY